MKISAALWRFGMVGVLNTAVDIAVFTLLTRVWHVPPVFANPVSYGIGLVNSFVCNKFWTFGGTTQRVPVAAQFVRFSALNLAGLALSTLIVGMLQSLGATTAKLISVPIVFAWNYWASRRFVYRP